MLRRARTLLADRRAVAALELALITPVLIVVLFGVYDLSEATIVYQQVYNAAHSIASSASSMAVLGGSNGATNLTFGQVQLAESEIWGQMPSLRTGFQTGAKSITISSVVFELTNPTCVPSASPQVQCNYSPYVAWSVAYIGGDSGKSFNDVLRSCATPLNQSASNAGASSDMTNIRTANLTTPDPNVSPPSPILVVDVNVQYKPLFGLISSATGGNPFNFWATGFWPVRSVQAIATNSTTPLTLNQQFTTITATSLVPEPTASYCVDTSTAPLLTPPGPTT